MLNEIKQDAQHRMDQAVSHNTFDVYKAGWNSMQDKYDKSYQYRLK